MGIIPGDEAVSEYSKSSKSVVNASIVLGTLLPFLLSLWKSTDFSPLMPTSKEWHSSPLRYTSHTPITTCVFHSDMPSLSVPNHYAPLVYHLWVHSLASYQPICFLFKILYFWEETHLGAIIFHHKMLNELKRFSWE